MSRSRLAWPFLAVIAALVVLPLGYAGWLAFTDYTGIRPPELTGLSNLRRLTDDGAFWETVAITGALALVVVPLRLGLATAAALLLYKRSATATFGRVSVYLPSVIPDAAWALLWLWILNPLYGPLPALLSSAGVPAPGFLTTQRGAFVGLALVLTLQIGEAFVVALAARAQIPRVLYEVAAVEGMRPFDVVRRISLPLMAPILGLLAVRDLVLVLQVSFVPALLISGRDPLRATLVAPLAVYRRAFQYGELGYASLLSLVLLALTAMAAALVWRGARVVGRGR